MEKILITGASSGIGEELTRNLANKSKKLFLLARSLDKLNLLKKELGNQEYKEYQKILLLRLLEVTQIAARKYTRSKVRKLLPKNFDYIIEELLYKMQNRDKEDYYEKIFLYKIIMPYIYIAEYKRI